MGNLIDKDAVLEWLKNSRGKLFVSGHPDYDQGNENGYLSAIESVEDFISSLPSLEQVEHGAKPRIIIPDKLCSLGGYSRSFADGYNNALDDVRKLNPPPLPSAEQQGWISVKADINNKLTPFKNLIAMLEAGTDADIVRQEVRQCKENLEYLINLPSPPVEEKDTKK